VDDEILDGGALNEIADIVSSGGQFGFNIVHSEPPLVGMLFENDIWLFSSNGC